MAILNAVLSGGTRRARDFYPTPPEATRALLPRIEHWPRLLWEPACGDGAMSKILIGAGFAVISSDISPVGYGHQRDFLNDGPPLFRPTVLVTNPPFNLASEFILRAHDLGVTHMALLLKADFWHAARRLRVWDRFPPTCHLPMTFRLDFTGAGAPHTNCSWFLWEPDAKPLDRPLEKPDPHDEALAAFLNSLDRKVGT